MTRSLTMHAKWQNGDRAEMNAHSQPKQLIETLYLSKRGAQFIAEHEGAITQLYNDPAGHCTIGIGHLIHYGSCTDEDRARYPDGLSESEMYTLFIQDTELYQAAVRSVVSVPLTQPQFDALVSFSYNLGANAITNDNDLRQAINLGDNQVFAECLRTYVHGGGKRLPGLVKRRDDEIKLYVFGHYG